jgi:ubiquinone/menaquinone biosynthesis C-methylase UbiE
MHSSISENNGLAILSDQDKRVYSVGISTGGVAEIQMAKSDPKRQIIATTLDSKGAQFAQQQIEQSGLSQQIDVKIEDVSEPLSYSDGYFDYIYARLVLHYLPKLKLIKALNELYRVLKWGGKLFVVVRSEKCPEAKGKDAQVDPMTGMTTYTSCGSSFSRYFHSEESIQTYLKSARFHIQQVKSYEEQLCIDFERCQKAALIDVLIEVFSIKS